MYNLVQSHSFPAPCPHLFRLSSRATFVPFLPGNLVKSLVRKTSPTILRGNKKPFRASLQTTYRNLLRGWTQLQDPLLPPGEHLLRAPPRVLLTRPILSTSGW